MQRTKICVKKALSKYDEKELKYLNPQQGQSLKKKNNKQ